MTHVARMAVAFLIGLAGSVFIWFAAPFNNFVMANAFVSDDFMPVAAVSAIVVVSLAANPLLRRYAPRFALDRLQLCLIFGMFLVACITPSQGFLRHIMYPVGATPSLAAGNASIAQAYEELDLPRSFFPAEVGLDKDTEASDAFLDELQAGESIPWEKWVGPLFSWMGFFLPYWLMLVAMAVIVFPQWRDSERQPFPLLEMQ